MSVTFVGHHPQAEDRRRQAQERIENPDSLQDLDAGGLDSMRDRGLSVRFSGPRVSYGHGAGSTARRTSMMTAGVIVVMSAFVLNAAAAAADFFRARFVLANSAELGVPERWLPLLGALKAAGAAGLLIGLLWVRPIGIAAAAGLVLFFVGAIATHVRARVLYNLAFPGFYLALAVGSLILIGADHDG